MPKEYRSRNRIMLDLMRAIRDEPGSGKTRLLAAANLSTDRLQGYLADLSSRGLIAEEDEDRSGFRLTPAGRSFIVELDRVDRFMGDFGLSL